MEDNHMTDSDWLIDRQIEIDDYQFSERVSIYLEHISDPTPKQIEEARQMAASGETYDRFMLSPFDFKFPPINL